MANMGGLLLLLSANSCVLLRARIRGNGVTACHRRGLSRVPEWRITLHAARCCEVVRHRSEVFRVEAAVGVADSDHLKGSGEGSKLSRCIWKPPAA